MSTGQVNEDEDTQKKPSPPAPPPGYMEMFGQNRHTEEMEKFTIFLVEDDHSDRDAIMRTLQKSPYVHNVHWFVSGDNMLRHFMQNNYYSGPLMHRMPMMILLDIAIPGTDGIRILEKLKDNPFTRDIPIIMVTGNETGEATLEAFRLHANGFVAKPLQLERVHEVMFTGDGWPKHADKKLG